MIIRKSNKNDLEKIVSLHLKSLKYGMLYLLGPKILKVFYEEILIDENSIIFSCIKNKKIIGVAASTLHTQSLFVKIRSKHKFAIFFEILKKSIHRPKILLSLISNYSRGDKAELLFLYVGEEFRNKGIGKKLVKETIRFFRNKNTKSFRITIPSSNIPGKKFYEKNGFEKIGTFKFINDKRDIYEYNA